MRLVKRSALVLILATSLAGATSAWAAEEPPLVSAILKNWETQLQTKPTYKSVTTGSDGSVVIDGLSANLQAPGEDEGKMSLNIAKVTLSGITDKGNGLFEVAAAEYNDTTIEVGSREGNFTISVPKSSAEYWYVKALGDNPSPTDLLRASMNVAKKMSSGQMTLAAGGHNFTADGYQMTWDGDPVTGAGKSDFKITNITVPEAAVAALDTSGTLKQLGYSTLSFDIGGAGTMDIGSDKMGFDFDIAYAGKDMATLKVGAGAGEIPLALVGQLQKLKDEAQPDPNAFMPLVQGIQVSRVTIRFEDKSITKKVLPLLAAMQGMDEATMVANAGAMLQLGLAELKNPAFTQKAVEAVNAYLKDPRSLTIVAKPAQPITVQQIMALDPNNPGAALDQLGVSISAND